jgi:hypothetical protein
VTLDGYISHPVYDREVTWTSHALAPTDMVKVTGI